MDLKTAAKMAAIVAKDDEVQIDPSALSVWTDSDRLVMSVPCVTGTRAVMEASNLARVAKWSGDSPSVRGDVGCVTVTAKTIVGDASWVFETIPPAVNTKRPLPSGFVKAGDVNLKALAVALSAVIPFADSELSFRPEMASIALDFTGGNIYATNGHMLAVRPFDFGVSHPQMTISKRCAKVLIEMAKSHNSVGVSFASNATEFDIGEASIWSINQKGYPVVEKVIPAGEPALVIDVDKDAMIAAMKMASVSASRSGSVTIDAFGGCLRVNRSGYQSDISVNGMVHTGTHNKFAIDYRKALMALKYAPTVARIEQFGNALGIVRVRAALNAMDIYIMPMRSE